MGALTRARPTTTPESTEDNGLCEYGCTDQPEGTVIESLESVVVVDTTGNAIIETVIVTETCGCTDNNATNYYPESTADNGLCEYANDCANQPEGTTATVTTFVPTLVVDSKMVPTLFWRKWCPSKPVGVLTRARQTTTPKVLWTMGCVSTLQAAHMPLLYRLQSTGDNR